MPRLTPAALCLPALLAISAPALAQDTAQPPAVPPLQEEPIGLFVVDARGTWARFKQLPAIGTALGVDANTTLPGRGVGAVLGAHVYPLRGRGVALGIGGEVLLRASGSRSAPPAVKDGPEGPVVRTRMSALSPQVSLNFGKRDGWSYVSGGIGWATYTSERADAPFAEAEARPRALNYGGGARWFTKKHLAFALDLRFYAINPQEPTAARPPFPRMTVMVFSAGIATR
ncbi:MAG TPA: hypothetical protein VM364_10615 [Vicinamibacterales bacterium]|nr:hypothetical protein [Vicinamibacterales bacterium]